MSKKHPSINLNDARPFFQASASASAASPVIVSDQGEGGGTECFFKDLDRELLRLLREHQPDAIIGCVAWMTHPDILQHLIDARIPCAIAVQKERSLQPDKILNKRSVAFFAAQKLRRLYDQVTPLPWEPHAFCCVGIVGTKAHITPIMHHKFLVFLHRTSVGDGALASWEQLAPGSVWNGSWNISRNGTNGFDNATFYAYQPHIANTFLNEAHFVHSQAEPLDWKSRASKPAGKAPQASKE